jgi:hypothetical protein
MSNYGIINDRSPHIIADLCEIICFCELISVSRGDIESFIQSRGGAGLMQELIADNDTETNERIQRLTEDAFQHLLYRAKAFGNWYPFTVNHDVLDVKEPATDRHKIYAILLIDSRLKMLPGADRIRCAAEFEVLCYRALPALLPNWKTYHFGKGGLDRDAFGQKLNQALPALAGILKDDVLLHHVAELSDHNTGDAGIDLVALYEWKDGARGVPAYLGQCAAQQKGWPEKKYESSPHSLERYMSFFHKPGTILFIPVCYHGPDGKWVDTEAFQTILVDRLRLIELLEQRLSDGRLNLTELLADIAVVPEPGTFALAESEAA